MINLDEFALKKGHGNFALVISAPEEGYVLDVLPNRERETLEKWLDGLSEEQRMAIKVVNVDMWEPYTLAIKAKLPRPIPCDEKLEPLSDTSTSRNPEQCSCRGQRTTQR